MIQSFNKSKCIPFIILECVSSTSNKIGEKNWDNYVWSCSPSSWYATVIYLYSISESKCNEENVWNDAVAGEIRDIQTLPIKCLFE